jgi:hypothetical protein
LFILCEAILGILEPKSGLAYNALIRVNDIVVFNDTIIVAVIVFLVAVGHQHELSGCGLPKISDTEGEILNLKRQIASVLDTYCCHLGVGAVTQAKIVQLNVLLVLVTKPSDHGVVVAALDRVLLGSLFIF